MESLDFMLSGNSVRLEPLSRSHVRALAEASSADPSLYRWSPVPQGFASCGRYVDTAIAWREAGTAAPFAIIRLEDGKVVGSTRFWNIDYWAWPEDHPRHGGSYVDACEIGYTWFTKSAIRTVANTEAKFLMLNHAFETWRTMSVCFHTDARNQRSSEALQRIGAKFEGLLRSHRLAADFTPRDSLRYSIVASEWPNVRARLQILLER